MKYGLNYFTDTQLTVAALLIFLSWFVFMVFWVYKWMPKSFYDSLASIPLNEDIETGTKEIH